MKRALLVATLLFSITPLVYAASKPAKDEPKKDEGPLSSSTFAGLAGLGDLLATANSSLSRNYRFGLLLAEGVPAADAQRHIQATVEGPRTARAALRLADREGWSLPICRQVVELLEGRLSAPEAVQALMEREPRPEEPQW